MSGFRPLFGDAAAFVPLQPAGSDAPLGETAPEFTPLYGKAAPIPQPKAPEPVQPAPESEETAAEPAELHEPTASQPMPTVDESEDIALIRAREEGFAIGRDEGLAAAQAEVASRVEHLDGLISELTTLRATLFRNSVQDIGAAITHISERVVGRELAVDSSGVEKLVIEVLDHVQSDDEVVIRIAPEDERQMRNAAPSVLDHLGRDATFRIELDPALQPGGAVVETQLGSIDASVETRFTAFEESVRAWVTEELGVEEPSDAD